jgi:hypothetical protein
MAHRQIEHDALACLAPQIRQWIYIGRALGIPASDVFGQREIRRRLPK